MVGQLLNCAGGNVDVERPIKPQTPALKRSPKIIFIKIGICYLPVCHFETLEVWT